jgi:hypothetical protein
MSIGSDAADGGGVANGDVSGVAGDAARDAGISTLGTPVNVESQADVASKRTAAKATIRPARTMGLRRSAWEADTLPTELLPLGRTAL